MQANLWHHELFHFYIFSFESGNCGKDLENQKSLSKDEVKSIFHSYHLVKSKK